MSVYIHQYIYLYICKDEKINKCSKYLHICDLPYDAALIRCVNSWPTDISDNLEKLPSTRCIVDSEV